MVLSSCRQVEGAVKSRPVGKELSQMRRVKNAESKSSNEKTLPDNPRGRFRWVGELLVEIVLVTVGERLLNPFLNLIGSLVTQEIPAQSTVLYGIAGLVAIVGATILGVLLIERLYNWVKVANAALQTTRLPREPAGRPPEGQPTGLAPTLAKGQLALVLRPKLWGVPAVLEIVKNGGEVRVMGADFTRWIHSRTQIANLIQNKDVKFTFLAPDPETVKPDLNLQRAIDAELVQKSEEIDYLKPSLDALHNIFSGEKDADDLKKKHGRKMRIALFDLPLTHSMAIAVPATQDPSGESKLDWTKAEVHLWPYLHTVHSDERPYVTIKNDSPDSKVKFGKCLESYQYVLEHSTQVQPVDVKGQQDRLRLVYEPLHAVVRVLPRGHYTVGTSQNEWSWHPEHTREVVRVFTDYHALIENDDVWIGWRQNEDDLKKGKFLLDDRACKWLDSIESEYNRIKSSLREFGSP
jgi:hypothetical protein